MKIEYTKQGDYYITNIVAPKNIKILNYRFKHILHF